MKSHRVLLAGVLASAAALPLATAAEAKPSPPPVPSQVKVPEGNKLFLKRHAEGVQIYTCNATAAGHVWGPGSTPRADLFNRHGKHRGIHYGGPTWEDRDGSKVVAARGAGVPVDPTAIPWLLLKATSTSPGPNGGDKLARTTYIQRVATTGGLAPTAGCNAATVGTQVEVPYTADYYFWKAKKGH
jgi:hypothetical protein